MTFLETGNLQIEAADVSTTLTRLEPSFALSNKNFKGEVTLSLIIIPK